MSTIEIDLVLQIFSRVDGVPTHVDGRYVVDYDPTFDATGHYYLDTSSDIQKARGFSRVSKVAEYIMRPSPNVPFDSPGHINRPLTCYHLEIVPRHRR